ncbi:MAG: hypothetical protein JNL55_04750 [Steroidobacter sp.]|nr:hypothetical protein [Steroidobacter sp.]
MIQAVGTEFNVQRRAAETMVSVIEGRVAVGSEASSSRQILAAGQSAELTEAATIASITPMDARKVTAWQQRRLIFRGDTLADVVAEFNRYNKAPQFLIADPAIAGRQFTGVFDANAPESFARILSGTGDLALSRRDAQIVISQREPSE